MGLGVRSWMRDCPKCGAHYRITSWSYRWVHRVTLEPRPPWLRPLDPAYREYDRYDVHQLSHLRAALNKEAS